MIFHQALAFRLEVLFDLFPGDAAKCGVVNIETDVIKLVEVTENSHLGELGDSGDEDESQPLVGTFQHGVEGGKRVAEGTLQVLVLKTVEQRLVVLVDQDDNTPPGFLVRSLDDFHESPGVGDALASGSVRFFPSPELEFEHVM